VETLDSKVKLEGPSKSPRESPPPSQDAGRPSNQEEDGEDGDRESCCIRQDQRTKPVCEDQKMTKPKWVPKNATPAKSVDPK
jgi:hypothetical protein